LGAWRWSPAGACVASAPYLSAGKALMTISRVHAQNEPYVFIAQPEKLLADPGPPLLFVSPDTAVHANGDAVSTAELLVLREMFKERITVREFATGKQQRPDPPISYLQLSHPAPVGNRVFYGAWTGYLNSVWVHDMNTGSQ